MNSAKRKDRMRAAAKWVLLSLIILLAFAVSTTGGADAAKPLMLIPIVICISIDCDELTAGIVGVFCGLMLDISTGKLLGANAIFLLIAGVFTSLIFLHFMRKNIINAIIVTIVVSFLHGIFDFFFFFAMWNFESYLTVFKERTIPSFVFTVISSPFIYIIIKLITSKFSKPDRTAIEQTVEIVEKD